MHQQTTALVVLLEIIFALWILCFVISVIARQQMPYLKWTKQTLSYLLKKRWELLLGIAIGWLLSTPGTLDFSII